MIQRKCKYRRKRYNYNGRLCGARYSYTLSDGYFTMLLVKRDSIFEDGLHPVFFQACGIAVLFNLFQGLRASFLQHVAFCVFDFNDNSDSARGLNQNVAKSLS